MIVAFTGHRPNKLGGYGQSEIQNWVRARISETLRELKPEGAISGMAIGVDQWAAEESMALGIPVLAAIPFIGQESTWPGESQQHYLDLLAKCEAVHVVCKGGYSPKKMQIRNEFMVKECDLLIAVWNGSGGGTGNCVDYAAGVGKKLIRINPYDSGLCGSEMYDDEIPF